MRRSASTPRSSSSHRSPKSSYTWGWGGYGHVLCAITAACLLLLVFMHQEHLASMDSVMSGFGRLQKPCVEFVITHRQEMAGCDSTTTLCTSVC